MPPSGAPGIPNGAGNPHLDSLGIPWPMGDPREDALAPSTGETQGPRGSPGGLPGVYQGSPQEGFPRDPTGECRGAARFLIMKYDYI